MSIQDLNIISQCSRYRVGLWSCPHFLFPVMGIVIIITIIGANIAAQKFTSPEVSALIVLSLAGILFSIAHVIIGSFERVAESARAKAEFINIISHQLRNPLTSIRWQLELLVKEESPNPKARSYINTIGDNTFHMLKLVNDLLAVSRIENNLLTLNLKPVSLDDMTQRTIDSYGTFTKASNITIQFEKKADVIPHVRGDEVHTRWIVENLIDNAVRYANPQTTVKIVIAPEKNRLRWSITNIGPIIPEADKKKIFSKFFRAETSVKLRTEGSGIGLFVAKSVVEASGGTISFTSDSKGRTTFWFVLPITS